MARPGWTPVAEIKREIFYGELGMVLLECIDVDGYQGQGAVTCTRYDVACGSKRYVDKRDMPGLPRDKFKRVEL